MTTQLVACLIIHNFKENDKLTEIDLSKQKVFNADPKSLQQINFTEI